jgi:heme/copper-type cytochrome/quinol oxidase subunit 2
MKRLRTTLLSVLVSILIGLTLTAFDLIYEGLPAYVRAPGSLLLAPVSLVDGICRALGFPGTGGRLLPVFLVNLAAGLLLSGLVVLLYRRRRTLVDKPAKKRSKRPIAVTVIAWAIFILFLVRLYQVFKPLAATGMFEAGLHGPLFAGIRFTEMGGAVFTSVAYALLSFSGIVVLIGFLRMQRWSWIVLMAWTCISLTITLIDYFYSEPNYIVMASDTIIAFALNQADVQRIFRIRTDPGERLD